MRERQGQYVWIAYERNEMKAMQVWMKPTQFKNESYDHENFKVDYLPSSHQPIILLWFLWKIAMSNCFTSAIIYREASERKSLKYFSTLQSCTFKLVLTLSKLFCLKFFSILLSYSDSQM